MKKIIICLLMLPSCQKIRLNKEYRIVYRSSEDNLGLSAAWNRYEGIEKKYLDKRIAKQLKQGITRDQAVSIALQQNPALQAQFESLGIAKSDLVQAGFFTNPHIVTAFKIPKVGQQSKIDADLRFTISDFWKIPIRKQVAHDDLERTTQEILHTILEIATQAKMAYDTCIYQSALLHKTKIIFEKITQLRDRIYYRHQFGYSSDLDIHFADMKVGQWQAKVFEQESLLKESFAHLREVFGMPISTKPLRFLDAFTYPPELPTQATLEQYALINHPEMQIAQINIMQAKHTISLERSRIFDDVTIGISYEREFEKTGKGAGPLFGISLPLFDTNMGNIKRAKYQLHQAEYNLLTKQLQIQREIQVVYEHYLALIKEIDIYNQKVIPASKKAIKYTETYFEQMQLNMLVIFESQITLYESEIERITLQHEAAHTHAALEKAIGSTIEHVIKELS